MNEQFHLEGALEVLSLYTASKPMVDVFRESADLSNPNRVTPVVEGGFIVVFAPSIELPKTATLAISNCEGLVSDDRVKLCLFTTPYENLCDDETDVEPWATIESGYGFTEDFDPALRGKMSFVVETTLPEQFDPTSRTAKWALGRVIRVGELFDEYFKANGRPQVQLLSDERSLAGFERIISSMQEQTAQRLANLRRPQQ